MLAADRAQGQRPLVVSFVPSTPHPGDVVRVEIGGASDSERITATVLGQDLGFHFDPAAAEAWRALVGIDLDTKPDAYRLHIHRNGTPRGGNARRCAFFQSSLRCDASASLAASSSRRRRRSNRSNETARCSPTRTRAYRPGNGRAPSCCLWTESRRATSARAATTTASGARRMPASISSARPGTPIRAANRGEIVVAAPMYFTGNTVVVDYGERLFSVFAHLSEIHVKAGDTVEPTTIVGLVGATGRVTGPHLHWSVRLERRARRSALARRRHERRTVNGNQCIWCRFFFRCTTTKAMRFDADDYVELRSELADRFGGVTAYMRAPARGLWKGDTGETTRDDIVIFEVMMRRPRSRVVDRISKGSRAAVPAAELDRPRADERAALIDLQGSSIPPMTSATSARRRDACSMSARPAGSPPADGPLPGRTTQGRIRCRGRSPGSA